MQLKPTRYADRKESGACRLTAKIPFPDTPMCFTIARYQVAPNGVRITVHLAFRAMQEPHLLKASANCRRLRANLIHLISPTSLAAIDAELDSNVKQMMDLADAHFQFALATATVHWRQRVSRFYYASYALSRAVRLHVDGVYTTDVKDHEKVGDLPGDFPRRERYKNDLRTLREDRNLCDYDHTASESELALTQDQAEHLVQELTADAKNYLKARGLAL